MDILIEFRDDRTSSSRRYDYQANVIDINVNNALRQLPPINESFNLMQDPMLRLETPHRFSEGSALIKLSMLAR